MNLVVPFINWLEIDRIEYLDVAFEASHDQPTILMVLNLGHLQDFGFYTSKLLDLKLIVLIKFIHNDIVIEILGSVLFRRL